MKKSIIIVVIIALAILVALLGLSYTSKDVVQKSISDASMKARNASVRSKTSMIAPYLELWAVDNKNSYAGFIDNPSNVAKIKPFIDDLENRGGFKVRYYISSTETAYVVRMGVEGETLFYCVDSTGSGSTEHMESVTDPFISKTNCLGKAL